MMGIINNLVLSFVEEKKGKEAKQKLLKEMERSEDYQPQRIYAEEEFQKLFKATVSIFNLPAEKAEGEFAKYVGKLLPKAFSGYFEQAKNTRELLRMVPSIHTEYPTLAGAPSAKLTILKDNEGEFVFYYNSPNQLCIFLMTLTQCVLDYYKEKATIEETQCKKKGAEFCRVAIRWE